MGPNATAWRVMFCCDSTTTVPPHYRTIAPPHHCATAPLRHRSVRAHTVRVSLCLCAVTARLRALGSFAHLLQSIEHCPSGRCEVRRHRSPRVRVVRSTVCKPRRLKSASVDVPLPAAQLGSTTQSINAKASSSRTSHRAQLGRCSDLCATRKTAASGSDVHAPAGGSCAAHSPLPAARKQALSPVTLTC